jgi:monoterpene epsilon-lactone hydrolase
MAPAALDLPAERPGHAADAGLMERRNGLNAAAAAGAFRTDPPAIESQVAGVRTLRFDPPAAAGQPRAIVLHLHGGGFRLGAPEMVARFAAALAARCVVSVVCPAYRLAPEHPFPAGLTDARRVQQVLAAEGLPVFLSGDSAGGGLAAGLAALSRDDAAPPAGLVLISPWLDLRVVSPSYERNAATDALFSRASAEQAAGLYLQGGSPEHPVASPLLGALAGFPPTLVSYGMDEVLADDGDLFHRALGAAGVDSRLSAQPSMEHVAVARNFDLPGAPETFADICDFIDARLPA